MCLFLCASVCVCIKKNNLCKYAFTTLTSHTVLTNRVNRDIKNKIKKITLIELLIIQIMSSVAILGGGISGLSAAYYLSKASPKTKILLIESSKRVGGWIRSQRVPPGYHPSPPMLANDPNNVLFEVGPRSLRPVGPGGAAILSMVYIISPHFLFLYPRL